MNNNRAASILTGLLLLASPLSTFAQDSRAALVQRIAVAQGLIELFDQQLFQQRDASQAYATKFYRDALSVSGNEPTPREKQAFDRFISRNTAMFSAKEIVDAWVGTYGKELTVQDLGDIAKYYESPIGRKDVGASKAAMPIFTAWLVQETQSRSTSLLQEFIAELRAALQ